MRYYARRSRLVLARMFCPVGTRDNSPAIHRWGEDLPVFLLTSPCETETGLKYALLTSDESLGYCQPTLRVEMLAVSKVYRSKNVGKDKAIRPGQHRWIADAACYPVS